MEAAGTIAIATATETHRIPATTSAATRAPLPTIRLRLLASLHDMERGGHRVVVETAEFSASDRVVTGLQQLEPVCVRVARGDVNVETERDEPEPVFGIAGAEGELAR